MSGHPMLSMADILDEGRFKNWLSTQQRFNEFCESLSIVGIGRVGCLPVERWLFRDRVLVARWACGSTDEHPDVIAEYADAVTDAAP
jgi:hypothetical protein